MTDMGNRTLKYMEVKRALTTSLHEGKWKLGQAIPSEPVLSKRLGVSVGTVRRAIGDLVSENILVRQQGRGTFVASHTKDYLLNVFFRIVDRNKKKEFPDVELILFKRGRADLMTARSLNIAHGDPIIRVQSILKLQQQPVIIDDVRLSAALFSGLSEYLLKNRDTTIYGLIQARYGIAVLRTEDSIVAALADEKTRKLLKLKHPAPILKITRISYTHKNAPVDLRIRYVNTWAHSYLNILGKH